MTQLKDTLRKLGKRLPSENKLPFLTLAFTLSALVLTIVAVQQQQNLVQNAAEQEVCPTKEPGEGDGDDGGGRAPGREATRAAREATRAARDGDGGRQVTQGGGTRVTIHHEDNPPAVITQGSSQAASALVTLSAAQKDQLRNGIKGQLIVKYKPGKSKRTAEEKLARRQARIKKRNARLNADVVQVPVNQEAATMAELRSDPDVLYVERDAPAYAVYTPNDKHFNQQYALHNTGQQIGGANPVAGKADVDIDAPEAWDKTRGGVTVAVLDTGIDGNHPDLKGQVKASKNFSDSQTTDDKWGHGTFVGGIIAAKTNNNEGVAGVCPECKLLNAKVLGDNGRTESQEPIADGIHWAVDQGAKVINLSLASQVSTQTMEEAVNYAWSKGVVVIAAAGNCGGDDFSNNGCQTKNPIMYPAAYDKAVAVSSIDNKGNKAHNSESGEWVDVAAPGVDIGSTSPSKQYNMGGGNGALNYAYFSGTSFAAPQVAGIAALAMSQGGASASNVRNKIESTAKNPQGTGSKHGLVNAMEVVGGVATNPDDPDDPDNTDKPTKEPKPCKSPKPTKDKDRPDKPDKPDKGTPKPTKVSGGNNGGNGNNDFVCRLAPNLPFCRNHHNAGCDDKDKNKDKDKDKKKEEDDKKKNNDKNKDSETARAADTVVITITEDGGTKKTDQSGKDGNQKNTMPDNSKSGKNPDKDSTDPCKRQNEDKNKDNKNNNNNSGGLLCRLAPFLKSCKDRNNNNNNNKDDNKNGKCQKNNDCKGDQVCKQGKCEKKDNNNDNNNNNKCQKNSDCKGDKVCKQGKCEDKNVRGASTMNELDPSGPINILEYNILYACMANESTCTPELRRASDRNNDGVVNRLDYDTLMEDLSR